MTQRKPPEDREELGRLVRQVWTGWAREQPDPKASWLVPWADLGEGQREVDRRIGEAVTKAERALIASSLRSVSPLDFLSRHGLRPGGRCGAILRAVADEIEGRTDG